MLLFRPVETPLAGADVCSPTNHLSLVMDHHCQVLEDLVHVHDVRLQRDTFEQTRMFVDVDLLTHAEQAQG